MLILDIKTSKCFFLISGSFKIIVIGKSEPGMIPYGYMLKDDGSLNPIEADFNNNKIAMLPYSSGTTGLPKGVMLTSKNIISNICQAVHCPELKYIEEATGKFNRISDKKNQTFK